MIWEYTATSISLKCTAFCTQCTLWPLQVTALEIEIWQWGCPGHFIPRSQLYTIAQWYPSRWLIYREWESSTFRQGRNIGKNEILPSSSYSSLNSNCCSGTCPFSNKLCWFQVHSVQSKLFHLFHSYSAEQLALVEYANVFYFPVLLWLLLPAGPVSPHTHHLGSLVPKPWTDGHHIDIYIMIFFLFFLAMSGKQIHNDQEPLLPRSKSTLW